MLSSKANKDPGSEPPWVRTDCKISPAELKVQPSLRDSIACRSVLGEETLAPFRSGLALILQPL
jgi:hypothetical protein